VRGIVEVMSVRALQRQRIRRLQIVRLIHSLYSFLNSFRHGKRGRFASGIRLDASRLAEPEDRNNMAAFDEDRLITPRGGETEKGHDALLECRFSGSEMRCINLNKTSGTASLG
jgi:hypothetical protein